MGFIRASSAAPIRPFVALVTGTWRVTASERARSSSNGTSSTPCRAACSAETNGSLPTTLISRARARSAIACPIFPRPTIPSVLPRSSWPAKALRFHSPRRIEASAAATLRASAKRSASVSSAAAIVFPVGALTTVIPARVAASRSTLSTPTPARPITRSRAPAAIISASTFTWLRTTSASYPGRIARYSSGVRPTFSSTSWLRRRISMPSRASGSATRILMPGSPGRPQDGSRQRRGQRAGPRPRRSLAPPAGRRPGRPPPSRRWRPGCRPG